MGKEKGDDLPYDVRHLLIALFIVSLLVRVHYWPAGLFHTDSVIAVQHAEKSVNEGKLYYLQGKLGYPGYAFVTTSIYFVGKVLFGLKSAEQILIGSSVLFGCVSVIIMYLFTYSFTSSKRAGFFSALILSFMPLHMSLSTYVKDQMLGACFIMASLVVVHMAAQKKTLKLKLASALLIGYTLAIRQQEFLLFIPFLLTYVVKGGFISIKSRSKGTQVKVVGGIGSLATDLLILCMIPVLVFYASFLPRLIWQPDYSLYESFFSAGSEQMQYFEWPFPLLTEYAVPWALLTLTYLGVALLLYGMFYGYKNDKVSFLILCSWMIPYFFILGNMAHVSPYFIFPSFLPAASFMGWGLAGIAEKKGQALAYALAAVLVVYMLYSINPVLEYRSNHCGPCELAKKIGKETPYGSLIESADESRHIEYYAKRTSLVGRPFVFNTTQVQEYFKKLRGYTTDGVNLYMTSMGTGNDVLPPQALALDPNDNSVLVNRVTGRSYGNLELDPSLQLDDRFLVLIDRQTGNPIIVRGLYTLELFNNFIPEPVFRVEDEDWHHADLQLSLYNSTLFRLIPRNMT